MFFMSVWNFYASYGNWETKSTSSSYGFTLQLKFLDSTDIQKRKKTRRNRDQSFVWKS